MVAHLSGRALHDHRAGDVIRIVARERALSGHEVVGPFVHNGGMVDKSRWMQKVESDPDHSRWYVERFRSMAAAGEDLDGEARLIDAMTPPGARILDAGCGPGRVGAALAQRGHTVVGVDVDPVLVEAARHDHPDVDWFVGDLAELDLSVCGVTEPFDAVVCAGNVMPFLAPSTREAVLTRLRAHVSLDGRGAFGFAAGRGYTFADFFHDADHAGWEPDLLLSSWDLRPLRDDSSFLVALLRPRSE